ncbi:MAG: glycosyltransferase family 2 protein [Chitinophagales bacterium]
MKYSIIVPVYNSSNTLNELINRICSAMNKYEYEIILVDDGSVDNSWNLLTEIKKSDTKNNIRIIKLAKNYSQQNATMCGLKHAVGDFIVTIDDDLQIPPEEIPKLIEHINTTKDDVVYGIYKDQQQALERSMLKKVAFHLVKKINPLIDKTSSFRILNRNIVNQLTAHSAHFINIDEMAQWYTRSISTILVEHIERQNGKSGYTLFGLIKLSVYILFNYYSFPLQLITSIGFYTSLFSVLLGCFYIFKKVFFEVGIEGWTSLMVVLLFSTGIIVFSIGILGKYLLQVISSQHGKPAYTISEIQE